jgi:hypothetical protein
MRYRQSAMIGRISLRARAAALLPLAALAVHDLRYRLAYGGDAGHELARQGHAYLGIAKPLVGVLCALLAAELVARLARAWRIGEAAEQNWSRSRLWALATAALVAVFFGQELLEGAIFAGHPAGLAGVLGAGGWLALPLSFVAGGVLILFLAGARAAARALTARHRRSASRRPFSGGRRPPVAVAARRSPPLASAAAGRAPPRLAALHT